MINVGRGVLFGLNDITAVSLAGLCQLTDAQSQEITEESDEELVKDANGVTKAVNKFDIRRKMTLEFIPTSGTNTGTLTAHATAWVGATLTITNAIFAPAGGTWIIDGVSWPRANNRALMARFNLSRYVDGSLP
jgi:hypothetical protein